MGYWPDDSHVRRAFVFADSERLKCFVVVPLQILFRAPPEETFCNCGHRPRGLSCSLLRRFELRAPPEELITLQHSEKLHRPRGLSCGLSEEIRITSTVRGVHNSAALGKVAITGTARRVNNFAWLRIYPTKPMKEKRVSQKRFSNYERSVILHAYDTTDVDK